MSVPMRYSGLRPRGHELHHWPVQDSFAHPIANEQLRESMIRFAHPRDFGALMKPDLESSETLTVYLNANLVSDTHSRTQENRLHILSL